MKTLEDSVDNYVCVSVSGCGLSIFNAQREYDKCPKCGGTLIELVDRYVEDKSNEII